MKQKIVIQTDLESERSRKRAIKTVASTRPGEIDMIAVEGLKRDQLVVVGDGVDATCIVRALKKKPGCVATILKVEEFKKKTEKNKHHDEHETRNVYGGYGSPPTAQAQVVIYGSPADPPSCIVM